MSRYYFSLVNVARSVQNQTDLDSVLSLEEQRNDHSLKYKDMFLFLLFVVSFYLFFFFPGTRNLNNSWPHDCSD